MSGLVAARRSLLSEDHREKSGPSQSEVPKLIARFPGSFKEASESTIQQDQKHHSQAAVAGSHQKEDGRNSNKDPILVSFPTLNFLENIIMFSMLNMFVTYICSLDMVQRVTKSITQVH